MKQLSRSFFPAFLLLLNLDVPAQTTRDKKFVEDTRQQAANFSITNVDSAIDNAYDIYRKAVKSNDSSLAFSASVLLGDLFLDFRYAYNDALYYLEHAELFLGRNSTSEDSVELLLALSKTYRFSGYNTQCMESADKALQTSQRLKTFAPQTFDALYEKSCVEISEENFDVALNLISQARSISVATNDVGRRGSASYLSGIYLNAVHNYASADDSLRSAIVLLRQTTNYPKQVFAYHALSKSLFEQSSLNEALMAAQEGYSIAVAHRLKHALTFILEDLSSCNAALHNYEAAFNFLNHKLRLNDTLYSIKSQSKYAAIHEQNVTSEKQRRIELLKVQNELSEATLSKQRILMRSLAGMAAIILISALIVLRNISRKRKAEAQLAELEKQHAIESVRNRISADIHDDLGAAITKVGMLSQRLNEEEVSDSEQKTMLHRIRELSQEVTSGLREIIWAANPQHDSLKSFLSFSQNFIHKMLDGSPLVYEIQFPDTVPEVNLHPELKRNLFLTLKESLNNALKHSQATRVTIAFTVENNKFRFSIADNGSGIKDEAKNLFGNGLKNMQRRMKDIDAYLQLDSAPGRGTQIIIDGNFY